MNYEQEQLFYELKQYLVAHSPKWDTLCDIEQLIINQQEKLEKIKDYIKKHQKDSMNGGNKYLYFTYEEMIILNDLLESQV